MDSPESSPLRGVRADLGGFLDDAPILAVIRDHAGRAVHVNRRYAETFAPEGFPAGSTIREVMSESVARVIEEGEAAVWTTGRPWQTEIRLLSPGGEARWYRVDKFPVRDLLGQPVGVGSIWTDLTEQKLAEQALMEQRAIVEKAARRLQAAVAAISDYAVTIVDADDRVELINPAAERMWGYPGSAIVGQTAADFSALVRTRVEQEIPQPAWDPVKAQAAVTEAEILHRHRDGYEFISSTTTTPIMGADGKPDGLIAIARDLTKVKQREAELIRARDAAEQANRAKDEFTGRMSHELRTPLNAILGFAQLLERDGLAPQHRELVGHVLTAGRLLLSLVNEVLEFEQVAAGTLQLSLEPVHVSELVVEVLTGIAPLAKAHLVTVINDISPDTEVAVRADRRRLGQILSNLLTNAVTYNTSGGQVRISFRTEGDLVRLTVADTGPGIPLDRQARMFLPFERFGATSSGVEGTGLGLALAKALTEALGGQIGVASRPGHGSDFWVDLPAATLIRTVRDAPIAANTARKPGPAKTVLYIEDNPVNVRLVEMLFAERPEVRLLTAETGFRGLDMAADAHPAMILLDLHLPDLDGDIVLARLREDQRTAGIPVIVVSADAYPADIARLRMLGADGYLSKPFDVEELFEIVDHA